MLRTTSARENSLLVSGQMTKTKVARNASAFSFPDPTRKGDRTRRKIVEATIRLIEKSGGGGLTFEAIGNEAGLPKAHVKYHFQSIELIVSEAIRLVTFW